MLENHYLITEEIVLKGNKEFLWVEFESSPTTHIVDRCMLKVIYIFDSNYFRLAKVSTNIGYRLHELQKFKEN